MLGVVRGGEGMEGRGGEGGKEGGGGGEGGQEGGTAVAILGFNRGDAEQHVHGNFW